MNSSLNSRKATTWLCDSPRLPSTGRATSRLPAHGTRTERSLAVCICTADRPALLLRCLQSIFDGSALPDQIIVSDDSTEPEATRGVCSRFPLVEYHAGPRRGLGANRNAAIAPCRTTHLSLLDDDAVLTPSFIDRAKRWIAHVGGRTLLTGELFEDETAVFGAHAPGVDQTRRPITNTNFWGFGRTAPGATLRSIHANCNVLPTHAFNEAEFDERLIYGLDAEDLCAHLLVQGYTVEYVSDLVTWHLPPSRESDLEERRRRDATRARFYATLKRHILLEGRIGAGLAFLVLAPAREVLSWLLRGQIRTALTTFPDFASAMRCLFDYRRRRVSRPAFGSDGED